jgi:hypothetical protein
MFHVKHSSHLHLPNVSRETFVREIGGADVSRETMTPIHQLSTGCPYTEGTNHDSHEQERKANERI